MGSYGQDQSVREPASLTDDVEMSIRDGIEGAWEKGDSGHGAIEVIQTL
jgi:hypothetical protein